MELLGLREAFPCGEPVAPPISLKIRVLNGATRCSPKFPVKEVVGCEISNTEIEFNGHEFSYVKHDTSEPVFGNGTITVDLGAALLHEMGHWAGINRHLTSPNNIMSIIVDIVVDEDVIKTAITTSVHYWYSGSGLGTSMAEMSRAKDSSKGA